MLPVIAASISGPNGLYKRSNVLLDSGAQISLIKSETEENLGLKGRDVSVNIVKVGGEEKTIRTKSYRVPVSGIGDTKKYSITPIGISCISEDVKGIHLNSTIEKLGLQKDQVKRGRGQVDLLIGIDHAYMHTGQTKQVEHLENCHAENRKKIVTRMGHIWLIYRATDRQCNHNRLTCEIPRAS